MSSQAVAHGWPDGEERPLPYGPLLIEAQEIFAGAGQIGVAAVSTGAWPSLGFCLYCTAGPVTVEVEWGFLDSTTLIGPTSTFTHPADRSLMLIPNLGHKVNSITFTGIVGEALAFIIVGSNRPAPSDSGQGRLRSISVPNPGAGVGVVPLYVVPQGQTAILHGVDFLVSWAAASNLGAVYIEHLDGAGHQVTTSELNAGGAARGALTRVAGNSHQGGTSDDDRTNDLPEASISVSRVLPLYVLPPLFSTQIRLADITAGDEIQGITVLIEEIV